MLSMTFHDLPDELKEIIIGFVVSSQDLRVLGRLACTDKALSQLVRQLAYMQLNFLLHHYKLLTKYSAGLHVPTQDYGGPQPRPKTGVERFKSVLKNDCPGKGAYCITSTVFSCMGIIIGLPLLSFGLWYGPGYTNFVIAGAVLTPLALGFWIMGMLAKLCINDGDCLPYRSPEVSAHKQEVKIFVKGINRSYTQFDPLKLLGQIRLSASSATVTELLISHKNTIISFCDYLTAEIKKCTQSNYLTSFKLVTHLSQASTHPEFKASVVNFFKQKELQQPAAPQSSCLKLCAP